MNNNINIHKQKYIKKNIRNKKEDWRWVTILKQRSTKMKK